MKAWVYKQSSKLHPSTSEDKEKFDKLPNDEPFMIKWVRVRNPRHHRLYFAFINTVYENLPHKFDGNWPDPVSFRKDMEMYAGYYTRTISLKGEEHLQPKSIKYEVLGEDEFSELHNKVKNVIGKHIYPYVENAEAQAKIDAFF